MFRLLNPQNKYFASKSKGLVFLTSQNADFLIGKIQQTLLYRKKKIQLVGEFYKEHHDDHNNFSLALLIIDLLKLSNASAEGCVSFKLSFNKVGDLQKEIRS